MCLVREDISGAFLFPKFFAPIFSFRVLDNFEAPLKLYFVLSRSPATSPRDATSSITSCDDEMYSTFNVERIFYV